MRDEVDRAATLFRKAGDRQVDIIGKRVAEHANLLRSLFEHRMEDDRPYPDDILQMVMDAFALMHPPLVRLLPDADDVRIALLSRTLFSAVHGIISLGLEERMVAVPPQMLRQQVEQFLHAHLAGLGIVPMR